MDAQPQALNRIPAILKRIEAVRAWRMASNRKTTHELAATSTVFAEIRQPKSNYLAFPTVSSVRRTYIPFAFLTADIVASNQIYVLPDATFYHFDVLTSSMHNAWIRYTCGRLKSDFRYSAGIVYNNFPWPDSSPTPNAKKSKPPPEPCSTPAHNSQTPRSPISTTRSPCRPRWSKPTKHSTRRWTPPTAKRISRDAERVAFLFEWYQALTSLLPVVTGKRSRKKFTLFEFDRLADPRAREAVHHGRLGLLCKA